MGNRYILLNEIDKELKENSSIIYDTYESHTALFTKKNLNNLLGRLKEYIPYAPIVNPYPKQRLRCIDSTAAAMLSHFMNTEQDYLSVYKELEKNNSNIVSKFFYDKVLEKYMDKQHSDEYEITLNLPDKVNLDLKEINNNLTTIYAYIKEYPEDEIYIENLILPDYFKGDFRIYIQWKDKIHIKNLIAPRATIIINRILDSIGSEAKKSFVIDNIECFKLINRGFYDIKIKNIQLNDLELNYEPTIEAEERRGLTSKISIENLNINTHRIVKILGNVDIKNRNQDNISDGGNNIKQNLFKDKKFVITGAISGYSNRNTIIDIIKMNGGKVSSTVNKDTDYLLCEGLSNSSKSKKAMQYGTKIINGDDFREMYKTSK